VDIVISDLICRSRLEEVLLKPSADVASHPHLVGYLLREAHELWIPRPSVWSDIVLRKSSLGV